MHILKGKYQILFLWGWGEPLLNYKNVVKAINKMKLPGGLNFSAKGLQYQLLEYQRV